MIIKEFKAFSPTVSAPNCNPDNYTLNPNNYTLFSGEKTEAQKINYLSVVLKLIGGKIQKSSLKANSTFTLEDSTFLVTQAPYMLVLAYTKQLKLHQVPSAGLSNYRTYRFLFMVQDFD